MTENNSFVLVPCAEDDPDSVGFYSSHDGRILGYVKERPIPTEKEKRLFQILDEMNVHDAENKTAFVGVCNEVISVDKVKKGTKVTIGAPEEAVFNIMNGKTIPILLLIEKSEYERRQAENKSTIKK